MLASEYNWAKDDILNKVYFDEVLRLQDHIRKRRLGNYRMLLQIQHTSKPEDLASMMDKELEPVTLRSEEIDKAGLDYLKSLMSKGSGFRIK